MFVDYSVNFVWCIAGLVFGLVLMKTFTHVQAKKLPIRRAIDPRSDDMKNEVTRQLLSQLLSGPAVVRIEVIDRGSIVQWTGGGKE